MSRTSELLERKKNGTLTFESNTEESRTSRMLSQRGVTNYDDISEPANADSKKALQTLRETGSVTYAGKTYTMPVKSTPSSSDSKSILLGFTNPGGGDYKSVDDVLDHPFSRGVLDAIISPDNWLSTTDAEMGLKSWSGQLDDYQKELTSLSSNISNAENRLKSMQGNVNTEADVAEYNKLYDNYEALVNDYNSLVNEYNRVREKYAVGVDQYRSILNSGMDRAEAAAKEIKKLEAENSRLQQQVDLIKAYDTSGLDMTGTYAEPIEAEIRRNAQRIKELRAEESQNKMQYYSSLALMDDYAELSAPGKVTGDERYYYINDIDNARYKNEHTTDTGGEPIALRLYQHLTDDERKIYNYLYASKGKEAADRFLDDIGDTLRTRQGAAQYEQLGTLGKALYWIPAGLEQFGSGIKQLFQSEALPVSPTLITSQLIQQEAQEKSPVLGTLYELGTTLSNMAPSILAGALGGWALGAAGLSASTATAIARGVGAATLGASAGGNAYTQKINEGYSPEAARNYSTLVGASEGALQYLLGGIGALSRSGVGSVAAKIAGLDNALGRVARTVSGSTAARLLGSMISEGTEEGLQELLEPAFAAIIFDEEYEADFEDAAYAFLLGALSAGIIEGPAAIAYARRPAGFSFRDMDGYADNGVDYFEGANTLEEVEARYRDLARQYHPDLGGDAATMAEINRQRTMARAFFRGRAEAAAENDTADTTPEAAANTERTDGVTRRLTAGRATEETTPETVRAPIEDQAYAEAGGIVLPTADTAGDFSLRAEAGATEGPTMEAPRTTAPEINAEGNIILPTAEEIMNGGIQNGQQGQQWQQWGDQVSDGDGGRLDGISTGGQAGRLAGSAEVRSAPAEQGRAAIERQNRARDLRLQEVSSAELGIPEGTDTRNVRVLPETDWDDELVSTAERVRSVTGREVRYVIGSIEVRTTAGETRRVRGVWQPSGDIIIQADNLRVSPQQIADHEIYHELAAQDTGLDYTVEERIREQFGEEEFARVVETYIQKLHGIVDLPANASEGEFETALARIKQEIFADAYAGINAFGAHAERFADVTRETVKERTGIRSRENDDATRDRTGPPAERYSYAGTNAANADLEALEVAKGMAEQNVSAETIRQTTGWFQGADGKWRFEIDDSGMRYSARGDLNYGDPDYWRYRELRDKLERDMLGIGSEAVTEAERAEYEELAPRYRDFYLQPGVRGDGSATASRLSDYIQHDELFEQYPQLRDARLVFEDMEDGKQGSYNPDTNTITLSESLQNSERDDALVHEIQHAIQEAEGFARGASPQYWAQREYESGDFVGERLQREHDNLFRSLSHEEQNQFTRYRELDRELNRTMFTELGTEEAADYERYEAEQDALYAELYGNEWFRKLLDLERRMDDIPGEYRAMYTNTSGEIEARDAKARRKLTADERRAAPPDLGNEKTIFAEMRGDPERRSYAGGVLPIKSRFSLSEPVERTADLVAVHNIEPYNLERTLELGAFPMPSIAIIRGNAGHDAFGDISVVFGAETIDPASDSRNRVYSRDAWTPTFPKRDTTGMSPEDILTLMERQPERVDSIGSPGWRLYMSSIESYGSLDDIRANESRIDGATRNSSVNFRRIEEDLKRTAQRLATPENTRNTFTFKIDDLDLLNFSKLDNIAYDLATAKYNKAEERRLFDVELPDIWADAVDDARDVYEIEAQKFINILAMTPKYMRTVDNVLAQEEAIYLELSPEEAERAIEAVNEVEDSVWNESSKETVDEQFLDWAESVIITAAKGPHTLDAVKIALEKGGLKFSESSAKAVLNLINETASIATRYFEAKPHRVVKFDEIRGIVVPDNTDSKLLQRLSEKNIPILEYRAEDEADRARVINSIEGARFSTDEDDDWPVEQAISSAKTSLRQVPALFKDKNVQFGDVNIDIGGGKAGWKNNRKTADYLEEIERYFDSVERRGKLIIASNPKAKLPKALWEVQPGDAVRYSTADDVPRPVIAKQDLRRRLLDTFSVPPGSRAELGRIIEDFADKMIRSGRYTEQDRSALFDKLYDAGIMNVAADPYYSDARNALVKRRMYVSDALKAEFGDDWNDFRKRAFAAGIYLTNNPSDMAPDMWQAELGETLPGLFDSDNLDMRSFMERVVQVAEEGRDEQVSLAEYTQMLAGENYVSEDEVLQDLEQRVDWELRSFAEKADLEVRLRGRGADGITNTERKRIIQEERANYWQLHKQYQEETRQRIAEERGKRHASEREAREKINNIIREEREKYWQKRRDYQQRADERVRQERERRWAVQAETRRRIDDVEQGERRTYYERLERYKEARRATDARERERRKAMSERRRETAELRSLQQRTLKQIQWLAKNQYRAPAELRQQWDEVLGDLDIFAVSAANEMNYSKKYDATWRDLAEMYKKARDTDPNFLPSQELERIVARLDNEKIGDLDIGALQDLYKAAVGLRTEFYNRNRVIGDEEGRLFAELYADSKAEIIEAPGGYTGNPANKVFNIEQLTPMNYLERMAGWNPDSAWYSMAKQLEKGERDERAYIVQANKLLSDWLRDNEDWVIQSDGQGKNAVWYEVEVPELLELGMGDKPVFGDSVKVYMTPSMKVHLYLESKNYDNLRHMVGGRTFPDKELYSDGKRQEAFAQGKTIRLAPETVRKLVSDLTPEERELAALLERYYNQFAAERINKVSDALYGYDRAVTKNYAPIYTNSNYNQKEIGKFDQTAEGVGNMKQRIRGAKNPSYNLSAYDAFERHVDQTARFVGMAIPARNWKTLLNWRERNDSMSDVITHKWGNESLTYITDLLTDLQGGSPRKAKFQISSFADKLWSNYISAVFGANPSIVLKQLGSIPLGGAYLGMNNVPSPGQIANIDRELISRYTSELDWRLMGYATPETKQLKDHPNWTQRNSFFRNVFGGGAITGMDGWAASTLWPWAENKVRREQPELEVGTQEQIDAGQSPFYKAVAAEFDNAVNRSQSMSDTLHNARIRKSDNAVLRTLTMFKSDAAQTYNAFRQTIGEAQYYKRKEADSKTQRVARAATGATFLAWIINAAWTAGVNFLVNLAKKKGANYRDDEDELTAQSVLGNMASDMLNGMSGVVILGEELAGAIGSAITGERWYGLDTPGIEQLNDTLESLINSGNSIKGLLSDAINIGRQGGDVLAYLNEHRADLAGGIKEVAATAVTYFPGLPVNNVEAYLAGLLSWTFPSLSTSYEDLFETPDKASLKGLEGDALVTRVENILASRLEDVSEPAAQTVATLFAAGYSEALPSGIPKQVTVTDKKTDTSETVELDAYQQQFFGQVWTETVGRAVNELVLMPEFEAASPEDQAKMLSQIYRFANETAKAETVEKYSPPSTMAEAAEDIASGRTLAEWAAYDVLSDDVSGTFGKLTDEGLDYEQALDVAETLDDLGDDATSVERYLAVARMPIPEDEKELALRGVMTDSAYAKYETARNAGIDTLDYCEFLDRISDISGDSRQERVWALIDSMRLTNRQKDVLHLAAGYKDSTLSKTPWHN